MATMTKADIIERVYNSLDGFSKKESAEIVELVLETPGRTGTCSCRRGSRRPRRGRRGCRHIR